MAERLNEYNRKRNFDKTGEPEGDSAYTGRNPEKSEINPEKSEKSLRFVVQHHIARRDHYDFRLEWQGALLSWAVPKGPSYNPRDRRLAVQVEDHPLEYRNFEGTIPKGEYGGGTVMLWDEGVWEPQTDVDEGLGKGTLKFVLKGRRLKGKWALIRIRAKEGEADNSWLLLKEKDDYAKAENGISEFTASIRTGRTMTEIDEGEYAKVNAARNPFGKITVQLAKLVNSIPEGGSWLYEVKYDGYRILAYLEGGSVKLTTRNGNDYTRHFQDIASSLVSWSAGRAMVMDGEMVIADAEGRTDFQALQNHMKNQKVKNLTYIAFDLLALDGEDLRGLRLIDRKQRLEALMKDSPENLHYSKHITGNGKDAFLAACKLNLEGIVGKKADSVYRGTRNGDWIKLKCDNRQEFVIGGFTLSEKKTSGVSSLLLGVYEDGELVYAGRAGTGLTARSMLELEKKFKNIKRERAPFIHAPGPRRNEKITWLEPELVAEIKFAEWTGDNLLRQASFKGLRSDKDPREINRENGGDGLTAGNMVEKTRRDNMDDITLAGSVSDETQHDRITKGQSIFIDGIKVTSPDKVIYEDPEVKKADVVRYYSKVSERMLPYAGNRILSIVRCPKGISESCFFKKHPGPDSKGVVTIPVMTGSGKKENYFYIENAAGLISEAQMGTLEFHTWGSRAQEPEKPDMMVFDLDPDEGMDLETVRRGVKDTRDILEQLSLISYLKTSGGKGYHVVVPLKPSADWDTFHDFARHIAEIMEQKWPDRYTSNVRKDRRKNRIFIDWIRNGRGATSIAPYSIRARKGAPVSMPIAWEELDVVAPDGVDMADALMRIGRDDPWKDFFQTNQRLK